MASGVDSLAWWQGFLAAAESLATTIAVAVGGYWTWLLFVRHRKGYPRIQISVAATSVRIDHGWLLHTDVNIANTGDVLVRPQEAELRVRTVVPLPLEVAEAVVLGVDPVTPGEKEILYPMLTHRTWQCKSHPIEIEPGEADSLHADFFIPISVKVVQLYVFVSNPKKYKQKMGWTNTTYYEIPSEGPTMSGTDDHVRRPGESGREDFQQKQQQRQKPQEPQQSQQQKPQTEPSKPDAKKQEA